MTKANEQKTPDLAARGSFDATKEGGGLRQLHFVSLHALLALHGDEADALAFLQDLKPAPWIERKCTNRSAPLSGVMKPKPLASLNHLTVPI